MHSQFSLEMDCYVSVSRILRFLMEWIVTLVYHAFLVFFPVMDCSVSAPRILCFSCNGLLRQCIAHSQFSLVLNCYVNVLRILSFLLEWIVTLVSRAFSIFSCIGLLR